MATRRYLKVGSQPDYYLLALVAILAIAGIAILVSASSDLGKIKFNDSYYYVKHQLYSGFLVGVIGFLIASKVPYERYKKFALPLLILSLLTLTLVYTPLGISVNNATRWVRLGPISFQPAELLKITFILYIAAWLANVKRKRTQDFREGFIPFILICGIVGTLLVLQPATSTVAILLGSGLIVYFASGAPWRYIGLIVLIGAIGFALLILVTPYRLKRVTTFLTGGMSDTLGASYHINQAKIAIGSGGLTGVGYGQSNLKVNYLPAPIDDSIFAIVAEELGFIGAGTLIFLFAALTIRMMYLARHMRDTFGKLLLLGFGSVIALQSMVHIAAISGVFPMTGVPLPFVSYGGTALAMFLTMMGISINISKKA